MTLTYLIIIISNTMILVAGQFLWKIGLHDNANSFSSIGNVSRLFLSPYILGGLFIYGISTVIWFFILSRVQLSMAYPFQSFAYIFAIIGSYIFFGEAITFNKVLGCIFIVLGVYLINKL
jgi:drug/metabolite transporter (DMT)-like permease